MSTRKKPLSDFVVIRALCDEPVKLRAIEIRGGAIDVVGSDETSPMPFHLERAYQFESRLFEQMRAAYESGNRKKLNELWNVASPFAR